MIVPEACGSKMARKDPKFPARGVRKDGDEENAVSGSLFVTEHHLRFEGGSEKIELTWPELVLELTKGKQGPVGFMHPDHPDWRFTAYEHRILKEPVFRGRTNLRRQIEDFKREQEGIGKVIATMCFVATFLVISFVAGYLIEQSIPKILGNIPTSKDVEIGTEIQPLVQERYTLTTSHTNTLRELNDLAQSLVPLKYRDVYDIKVHLIEDPAPNAFAVPGGNIYVCTGVLHLTEQPEQVAGILAHEIAHITQRHALRAKIAQQGPNMVMQGLLGNRNGVVEVLSTSPKLLIAQTFSSTYEREADELAWEYMLEAKIDPTGLAKFLVNLREKLAYEKVGGDVAHAFSSHGPTRERFSTLDRKAAYLDAKAEFRTLTPLTVPAKQQATDSDRLDF